MATRKLKIALVGCGQIADAHLQEVRKIPTAEAVAVCDRHNDLARQAAARFDVPGIYDDFGKMLEEARPDVVHVATPPQSHAPLALQSLAAGAHVYVEKPFTLDVAECDRVLDAARAAGRLVCVGHDHLYDPIWEEAHQIHQAGRLGRVVHVDAVQGYDLSGPFGKVFVSDRDHWVHRLPGGLFHNVVSHPVYKITEFLADDEPQVCATWFGTGSNIDIPTELRVMMLGARTTATILFSSEIRPVQKVTRIYGTRESIEVDLDGRTIRTFRSLKMPGPFAKIEAPYRQMREAGRTWRRSLWKFARGRIHYFAGMNKLFTLFYDSILNGTPPPIPPQDIRRVTAIMDDIFRRCASGGIAAPAGGEAAPRGRALVGQH